MNNVPSFPIELAESIEARQIDVPAVIVGSNMAPHEFDKADKRIDEYLNSITGFLRGHEHFFIDRPEAFTAVDFKGLDLSECRFPFQLTGIIYRYDFDVMGSGTLPEGRLPLDRDRLVVVIDIDGSDMFTVLSFYKHGPGTPRELGTTGHWSITPIGAQIRRSDMIEAGNIIQDEVARYHLVPPLPGIDRDKFFERALAEGVDQTELANTIADDFRVAFGFLAISSAKNVPVEMLPAPAKLNKKRAKKGRAPLPGYHVLDLGFGRKVERDGGESGRTHASPRLHTRRGHMRQCASGTITYVRPTLVGDPTKGVVSKDYKARIRT